MRNRTIEGIGLGLRFPHFDDILREKPKIPWFEVIADDFLNDGPHFEKLDLLRTDYPIALHSVSLNLGGVDEFNPDYLNTLKQVYERYQPSWISDHLCWTSHGGKHHHDLLPIPRTQQGLDNVCSRINYLQDYFKRPLVVENVTAYLDFQEEDYSESEFLQAIIEKTDCYLLLDISNVQINLANRGLAQENWWQDYPLDKVWQIHLAGGRFNGEITIDTHSECVAEADIHVLKKIYEQGYKIPAMIERDANIPSFLELESERQQVEKIVYEL